VEGFEKRRSPAAEKYCWNRDLIVKRYFFTKIVNILLDAIFLAGERDQVTIPAAGMARKGIWR